MVEAGAYEFADTEKFVAIGEEIMTPYLFRPSSPCVLLRSRNHSAETAAGWVLLTPMLCSNLGSF